jgi:carbon monoxide dehydrogenase subunit G
VELENSFTVPGDIDTAWNTLLDVEAIAPCMPGATLESVNGDEFSGNVKVKLGPVSMTYGGTARFISKDPVAHVAVIEGTGKETRGTGTAKANVTTSLVAEAPDRTRVDVATELTITGKAAQFGRGVMQDVAGRIVDQFSSNLESVIAARSAPAVTEHSDAGSTTPTATEAPAVQKQAEALDLGSVALGPVVKRVAPIAIAVLVVVAIVVIFVNR